MAHLHGLEVLVSCIEQGNRTPPSLAHPFGTDSNARDVLSRVLFGARTSLGIAGIAVTVALSVVYLGGFGASHPLAKKIGPWPSVLVAAGTSAAAAWLIADRKRPQEA